ncbi:hypothetical protein TNIN_220721 [Trichonephila inaurata madagascariensis]|uniref:Uncharacterized protein n=1 Tax=Trichonephila inaurata madagascariensis TaxID=2747483 RepID=A0A8X6XHX7_9ARAC|nr:hypothetical protein TNIN_220721 [Trichonephila inaurata madagascariensis]
MHTATQSCIELSSNVVMKPVCPKILSNPLQIMHTVGHQAFQLVPDMLKKEYIMVSRPWKNEFYLKNPLHSKLCGRALSC